MWLDLSPEEQLEVFTNVSQQTNLSPNAIEKDWWVTMTLKALFQSDCSHLMVFKGGTSLSKAWQLIERFSEDIDIAIDRSFFGFEGDLNRKGITNLRRASCLYVNTILKKQLDANLQAMGITGYSLTIQELKDSTQDPQTIELNYMIDFHLAEMYQVETRALKQAVRRNIERFPSDFMFKLTTEEAIQLINTGVSQSVIPSGYNVGASKILAFSEQGVSDIPFFLYRVTKIYA